MTKRENDTDKLGFDVWYANHGISPDRVCCDKYKNNKRSC